MNYIQQVSDNEQNNKNEIAILRDKYYFIDSENKKLLDELVFLNKENESLSYQLIDLKRMYEEIAPHDENFHNDNGFIENLELRIKSKDDEKEQLEIFIRSLSEKYEEKKNEIEKTTHDLIKEINQLSVKNEFELVGEVDVSKNFVDPIIEELEEKRDSLLHYKEELLMDNSHLYNLNKDISDTITSLREKLNMTYMGTIKRIDELLTQFVPDPNIESVVEKACYLKETIFSNGLSNQEGTISVSDFQVGLKQVLLIQDPTINSYGSHPFRVQSKNNEYYFLNPEFSDAYRGEYIIGKIVMIDSFIAGVESNHFNLPVGTQYHLVVVDQ